MRVYKNTKWQSQTSEGSGFKKISCIVLIILILGIFIWFFLFSDFFIIKQVIVEGIAGSQKKQVENILNDKSKKHQNLFSFPSNKTEKELKNQYKNFAEVKIYKGPPDALKVIVIERKPMLLWEIKNDNYVIDNYGVAYRLADEKDTKLPQIIDERNDIVNLGDKVLSTGFLDFISNLNKTFSSTLNIKISRIIVKDSVYEIMVYTEKDFYIIFDTSGNLDQQVNDVRIALEKIGNNKIEYLDLRVPGKVYYK